MPGKLIGSLFAVGAFCWLASPAPAQPFPGPGAPGPMPSPGAAIRFPYWNAPAPQAMPMPTAPVYAPPPRFVQIPVLVGATDFTRVSGIAEAPGEVAAPQAVEKAAAAPTATRAPAERPTVSLSSDAGYAAKCPSQGGWSAGAGIYVLKPMLADRTAFVTIGPVGSANPVATGTTFDWSLSASPMVWLGYTAESGLGAQLRYFRFDHSSDSPSTSNPGGANEIRQAPGLPDPQTQAGGLAVGVSLFLSPSGASDVLSFGSDIRIETLDLELTQRLTGSQGMLMVSAGARYLQSAMNYEGVLVDPTTPRSETVAFGHNFYAAGPTLSLGGYWYLDANRWAVIFNTRGSLLVGNSRQTFSSSQSDGTSNLFTRLDDAVVPIGEIELGLAWTPTFRDSAVVVQATVVDQTYFGVGSPSQLGGDLSLFGFQLSFGVGY